MQIENFDLVRKQRNQFYILDLSHEKELALLSKKNTFSQFLRTFGSHQELFFPGPNTHHIGYLKPWLDFFWVVNQKSFLGLVEALTQ